MTEVDKTCKILTPVPLRSLALLSRLVSLCGDQQGRAFVLYLLLKERRRKAKRDQATLSMRGRDCRRELPIVVFKRFGVLFQLFKDAT